MNQTRCSGQVHPSVGDKFEYKSENTVDGTPLADVHESPGQRCPNMCNLNEDIQRSHYDDSQSVGQHYTRGGVTDQDSTCPCEITSGFPSTTGRHCVRAGCGGSKLSLKTSSSSPRYIPDSCAQNPMLTSASKSLMTSSLFVRRLSRLRNHDTKSDNVTLKSPTKVLHPPRIPMALNSPSFARDQTATSIQIAQPLSSESTGKNCLSELDTCEIAFTIRMHPDDLSVQWLRQLALDGLSKQLSDSLANMKRSPSLGDPLLSTNSNSSSSPSRHLDNTELVSVDVKFTRAVDAYPNQASYTNRQIDSPAISVSKHLTNLSPLETTAKDHFRDAHQHSPVLKTFPSESSHCLDSLKPTVEFSTVLDEKKVVDPLDFSSVELPLTSSSSALPSPGNFKKLLRDRYLSSQNTFDRVLSAPLIPNCESNVENVTQPKSSSEPVFNSSKLRRIAYSDCSLQRQCFAPTDTVSPCSSTWASPAKSSSASNATGAPSNATTSTTILVDTLDSMTTGIPSSLSVHDDVAARNCDPSASVSETILTPNCFGGLTNDVVSTKLLPCCEVPVADRGNLLNSIQHALLHSSFHWYPQLANHNPLHVPVSSSLFDATANEVKPDVFSTLSPTMNSPLSWSSIDMRPIEDKLMFSFSPPSWTKNVTSTSLDLNVCNTDVKQTHSAPTSLQNSKHSTPTSVTSVSQISQRPVPLTISNDSPAIHHCPERDSQQHSTNQFILRPTLSSFNHGFKSTFHPGGYSPCRRRVGDAITPTTICSPQPSHNRLWSNGFDQLTSPGLSEPISTPAVSLGSSLWSSRITNTISKSAGDVPSFLSSVHSNLTENVAASEPPPNSESLTAHSKTTIHSCFPDSSVVTSTRTLGKSRILSSRRGRISAWSNVKRTVNGDVSKTSPNASPSEQLTAVLRSDGTKGRTSLSTRATSRQANTGGLYVCPICSKQFTRSDMLTRHAHVHTGHRPFECSACGQAFSRSDHLSTHQRTHTGQRPYRCPLCSYSACRRDMITRHLRVHQRRFQMTFDDHPVIHSPHSLLRCHFHLRPNVY
ncbi:hypothetical protein EG68_05236 [Paragonimus skrjabini miyazakii]|uniref:C2H2-type domain-containing protein n=1 Tax=Paragonimus skrjabini miyazakii TaxID=59628 RepID=A0A8S9Z130_9TREM|nr:hypothetical protein EG68_05236 [Paragonimus skrjabini miyazakii]